MICLQFKHHSGLGLCQIASQTVQEVRYFFQTRPVDTFLEQHPIVKVVVLQVQLLKIPLTRVHLDTDPASQLKSQFSGFLPFAPFFVDPFFQQKCIDLLHTLHELQSHHCLCNYHHQGYHCHLIQTHDERHHQLHFSASEVQNNHLWHHCT